VFSVSHKTIQPCATAGMGHLALDGLLALVLGDLGDANVVSIHCCYVSRSFINYKVCFEVYLQNYQYLFNCN